LKHINIHNWSIFAISHGWDVI